MLFSRKRGSGRTGSGISDRGLFKDYFLHYLFVVFVFKFLYLRYDSLPCGFYILLTAVRAPALLFELSDIFFVEFKIFFEAGYFFADKPDRCFFSSRQSVLLSPGTLG